MAENESYADFMQARYLAGRLGRFYSPDEVLADQHVGDPGSWNLYAYARNNPVVFSDPSGRGCAVVNPETGEERTDDSIPGPSCEEARAADAQGPILNGPSILNPDVEGNTVRTSSSFLSDWLWGSLPENITYGGDDPKTQELWRSLVVRLLSAQYVTDGCPVSATYDSGHFQPYFETMGRLLSGQWNGTQLQVGGFDLAVSRSGRKVNYKIENSAGFSSLVGRAVIARQRNKWFGSKDNPYAWDNPFWEDWAYAQCQTNVYLECV